MRPGVFAKTFPGVTAEAVLTAARDAGFEAAQYNMACSGLSAMPDQISTQNANDVGAATARILPLCAVSGTYNMIHPDPAERARGMARLRTLAAACRAMGTDTITLCTGTNHPTDQWAWHADNASPASWALLCEQMGAAIAIAEEYGLTLGIEPELANVVSDARAARRLLDEMQSDRLTIVLDPANLFETATLPAQRDIVSAAVDLLGDRIGMAHAKDRAADGEFATAGKGVIDFAHYLRTLSAAGFGGPLVAHGLAADEGPGVAAFLKRTLAAL